MVKRTSSLASNEKFQVRFLVELLRQALVGKPNGDGKKLEAGRACMTGLEGSTPSPSAAIETIGDNDRLPSWSTALYAGCRGFESHRRDFDLDHCAVAQW